MYYMGRAAATSDAAAAFIVTGQSGKVWTVTIPRADMTAAASSGRMSRFRCNCPDNIIRRGTCKHMLFIALRVLKISEAQLEVLEDGHELDLYFLNDILSKVTTEADEQYTAPAAMKERLKAIAGDFESGGEVPKVEPRLPDEDEQCPICMDELTDGLELVHCGYGCGKPVHKDCFERYTKAQFARFRKNEVFDNKIRCVTCRMDWNVEPSGAVGPRGMLMGRRAIDLADSMPEQFIDIESTKKSSARSKSTSSKRSTTSSSSSKKSTKRGRVSAGRVSKARSSSSRGSSSTKAKRQPKRIAKREPTKAKAEPRVVTQSKRTRKSLPRKAKIESTVLTEEVVSTKRKTKSSPKKEVIGKKEAVLISKATSARNARAARRNQARLARA